MRYEGKRTRFLSLDVMMQCQGHEPLDGQQRAESMELRAVHFSLYQCFVIGKAWPMTPSGIIRVRNGCFQDCSGARLKMGYSTELSVVSKAFRGFIILTLCPSATENWKRKRFPARSSLPNIELRLWAKRINPLI